MHGSLVGCVPETKMKPAVALGHRNPISRSSPSPSHHRDGRLQTTLALYPSMYHSAAVARSSWLGRRHVLVRTAYGMTPMLMLVSMTYGTVQPCVRHRGAYRLLSYLDKIPCDHCLLPPLYSAFPDCWGLVANPPTIGHIPAIMVVHDVRHLCFREADTENSAVI